MKTLDTAVSAVPAVTVQRALRVGSTTDPAEAEADAVADRVMRMPTTLQRCACSGGDPEELLRSPAGPTATAVPAATARQIDSARGAGGRPLTPHVRRSFEPRFGTDLGAVRVHDGHDAARLAAGLNARAFTTGQHVFFGAGEYRPGTRAGDRLLAHELTHTIQQRERGTTPPIRRETTPAAEHTPPPADLACEADTTGPTAATHTFRFTQGNATLSDADEQRIAEIAAAWDREPNGPEIRVDGYASAEGTADFNWRLSCDRALALARALRAPVGGGPGVLDAFVDPVASHGETDELADDLAGNRVATLTIIGTSQPEPPTPEPQPTPTPQPAPDTGCSTFEEWIGSDIAVFVGDVIDCICLPIKVVDIFDDVLRAAPLIGRAIGNDAVQSVISWADFLCGVFDFAQLAYRLGTDPGPCWAWANLDAGDIARLVAMAATIGGDLAAGPAAEALTSWIQEAVAETAAGLFIEGGPVGSAIGLALGFVVGGILERYAGFVVELFFDVLVEISQNYITYGTPFPLDACRACFALAGRVSASIDQTLCERWNAAIPESLRIPEWHDTPVGATP